ncbi:MAG: ribonuclease P protein component [Hyphomicrobium sp.]|nr:ribonuclease P protein component [Hyphomicrobium sp.]
MSLPTTLKVRAEFLAVRGGVRASVPSCLIEARKRRSDASSAIDPEAARFGFTVTKKLGNAVTRNRIRRRLKSAVGALAPASAKSGYDYVVVARAAAFDRAFADILADLSKAFAILHREALQKPSENRKKLPRNPQA